MNEPLDVAIVGAGIVGLAHAWSAAERGHRVTIFERSSRAAGASIRNFGMIWPIGQPAGELRDTALLSRRRWLQLADEAEVWVRECGSIHLAHQADEWAVLEEFHAHASEQGIECQLLAPAEVAKHTPAANLTGLIGGLFSTTELCVNPVAAVRSIPHWLKQRYRVQVALDTEVISIKVNERARASIALQTSRGVQHDFDRVVICGGIEFQTLFPESFTQSGLKVCKLQMMKTVSQAGGWRIGMHLASGLTQRHYRNFEVCPSLAAVKERVARESPQLDRYGIHVMASQNDAGEVILGDSHEYGDDIEPFDKAEIDDLMLRELRKVFSLPDWTIAARWHGLYAKHPILPVFEAEPLPHVHVCTGTGGAGMTMSFGLAERMWQRWSAD